MRSSVLPSTATSSMERYVGGMSFCGLFTAVTKSLRIRARASGAIPATSPES